jgi:recombinational DNA repair protein (RecF pathway)
MFCDHTLDESAFVIVDGRSVCQKCHSGCQKISGQSVEERRRLKAIKQNELRDRAILADQQANDVGAGLVLDLS